MRLITRKLWRAFPELDRFDDERCERFVMMSRRKLFPATLRSLVAGAVWLVGFAPTIILCEIVLETSEQSLGWAGRHQTLLYLFAFLILAAGLFAGSVLAMLARDRLLRGRVRRLLAARGKCAKCRYSLWGLPVPDNLTVICPECGLRAEVDPAFAELGEGALQRRVTDQDLRRLPDWLTPRRLLAAALVIGCVLLGLWTRQVLLKRELLRQVSLAASHIEDYAAVSRMNESHYPPADGSEDAWDILRRIQQLQVKAETFQTSTGTSEDRLDASDYRLLTKPRPFEEGRVFPGRSTDETENHRQRARQALARMASLGGFDVMSQLERARRAAPVWPTTITGIFETSPNRFDIYGIGQMNRARMAIALNASDSSEFIRALRCNLALARMTERVGTLDCMQNSTTIGMTTLHEVQLALMQALPRREIEAIRDALTALPLGEITCAEYLHTERAVQLGRLAYFFSDSERATLQPADAFFAFNGYGVGTLTTPVGSYSQNRAVAVATFDYLDESADQLHALVWWRVLNQPKQPDLALTQYLCYRELDTLWRMDELRMEYSAVRAIAAIELFKADNGKYPGSLSELDPQRLFPLPIDPFDGRVLRYLPRNPATDEQGRGYVLYCIGLDGEDNLGKVPPADGGPTNRALWFEQFKGCDMIFNDRDR